MEDWKQNWDDVFLNKVKKEGAEREREKREEKIKCHEIFGDRKG
jgi:hypothetical protein